MRSTQKKKAPLILACVIAIGCIIFASTYSGKIKTKTPARNTGTLTAVKTQVISNDLREIDTDGDGLKDWEESLWKSDPKNKDTDSDGTPDGDEVESGRNPVVKGPNDKVTPQEQIAVITAKVNTPPTTTGNIARELFANYVDLKKSGKEITPEMENQLIQNTLLVADYGPSGAKIYSVKDIKISSDISNASLRAYANSMGTVFRKNNPQAEENELVIMSKVLASRSSKDLEKLDPLIASYTKIVEDSLKVSVPQPLAQLHLEFINAFSSGLDADIQMRKLFEDAAMSLVGLKQYEEAAAKISYTHENILKYYTDQSIMFNENEDGYGFLHMIAH